MKDLLTYLSQLLNFNSSHPLLFTQIHFWAFFLIVYLFYAFIATGRTLTHHRRVCRNGYLFIVSLFFYYKTSGLFVLLLVFSTLLGWLLGIRMDHSTSEPRRKLLASIGVVVNLLVLCYFKYAYFFTDIYNATFGSDVHVINHLARWGNAVFHTDRFDAAVIPLPKQIPVQRADYGQHPIGVPVGVADERIGVRAGIGFVHRKFQFPHMPPKTCLSK